MRKVAETRERTKGANERETARETTGDLGGERWRNAHCARGGRYIVEADLGGLARRSSGRISHMIATSLWLVARSSRQQQARFKHSRLGRDSAVPARWQVPTDPESQRKSGGQWHCATALHTGGMDGKHTWRRTERRPARRTGSGRLRRRKAPSKDATRENGRLRGCGLAERIGGGEGGWLGTPARGRCGAMIVISARACRLGRIQRVGIAARPAGRHGAARARGF